MFERQTNSDEKQKKMKRIEVTNKNIAFHYRNFAGNVKDASFFKQGTFQGIPFAEETETPGKWRVIFKHPDTGAFYETFSWTNTNPIVETKTEVKQVVSDIEEFATCFLFDNMKVYYLNENADIMQLPDHIVIL